MENLSKENQIEEIAKSIYYNSGITMGTARIISKYIINKKSYRKASEVVAEVLADVMFAISKIVSEHIESDNSLTEAEVDIIHALAELKKKYTESENGNG